MAEDVKPAFQAGMIFPSSPCLVIDNNGVAWWVDPINFRLTQAKETATVIRPGIAPSYVQEETHV